MAEIIIDGVKIDEGALTSELLATATSVAVWHCDAVTEINAPLATTVNVGWCPGVTEINAPVATSVVVRYCDAVTAINAPKNQNTKSED
jgi:hypothetical protein